MTRTPDPPHYEVQGSGPVKASAGMGLEASLRLGKTADPTPYQCWRRGCFRLSQVKAPSDARVQNSDLRHTCEVGTGRRWTVVLYGNHHDGGRQNSV